MTIRKKDAIIDRACFIMFGLENKYFTLILWGYVSNFGSWQTTALNMVGEEGVRGQSNSRQNVNMANTFFSLWTKRSLVGTLFIQIFLLLSLNIDFSSFFFYKNRFPELFHAGFLGSYLFCLIVNPPLTGCLN